jgi:hypothetical protein
MGKIIVVKTMLFFGLASMVLAGPGFDHAETGDGKSRLPGGVGEKPVDLWTFLDPNGGEFFCGEDGREED